MVWYRVGGTNRVRWWCSIGIELGHEIDGRELLFADVLVCVVMVED